ncbi:nose resistant to fluoxetine protein 6-like [Chelonus insularis]|uniref:nose resistant to fluoxetine protein 6-like n=1 Tax=Chelonus insularis TaxID=460826 RepID=UPI00158E7009|nr:nose resistant to fluoxetine protein 6-like [Chelonus insularis]
MEHRLLFHFFFFSTILLPVFSTTISREEVKRPEEILLNVLTRPLIFDAAVSSDDCRKDSEIYRDALRSYEPWALQMYDASAKIPAGIITGNYKQLGNYDECLRVKNLHGFVGKACSATVSFKLTRDHDGNDHTEADISDLLINTGLAAGLTNWTSGITVPYEWLWCVPSSCGPESIREALESSLSLLKHEGKVDLIINITEDACHTLDSDHPVFFLADWLYISLLILFGGIVMASTTYDLVKHSVSEKPDSKDKRHLILTSFSLYTNGKSLMSTRRNEETINCLDGLRYLSICWIIYGHTYYLQVVGVQLDVSNVSKMHEIWTNLLILNGNIVTDTFFLLGGILLMYSELGRKEKEPHGYSLNVGMLYLHRYLRLTPAYAIVIGFYATLFYKVGSGPHWNTWVGANRDFCVDNWWTNLLYINNYVEVANMCMSQSWYLSVDMQLVWMSPIFLYPLVVLGIKHVVSITILSIGLIISVLTPLLITYFEQLTGTMIYYQEQTAVANVYLQIYTRVYARSGPYIIGLIVGCYLRHIRNRNMKMSGTLVFCGWIFATLVGCAAVFGPRGMYFPEHKYDSLEAAFYAGFHRTVFALSISWVVIATVLGYAGPIGALLSWSGWMPLGKLTYSAYLTHYLILLYNAGSVRTPGNLTTFGTIHIFLGNLGLTMLISVILSLCFEIPFIRLDRLLMQSNRRRSFASASYKPNISGFGSGESTNEIYRSFDDVSSTVSRSYDEIFDRYPKLKVERIYDSAVVTDVIDTSPNNLSNLKVPKKEIHIVHEYS